MYDIIVIGGGASGLLATLASCRKGKRVLLIEKQSQCGLIKD
jgi:predicted flavoprotein YhiN